MNDILHVERLVDEQRIGGFNLKLLLWCFLAMFADGYDITAMAFAAPELARLWQIESPAFGPVLSASLIGVLFGAPLLGWLGDRHGRRGAIIAGCIVYGLSTLLVIWATNLTEIAVLRFITGIGIGGLMPNTIALTSEFSPKRLRATLIVLMFTGITLGSGTPGAVAAWLVPHHGWQVLFLIGGVAPLAIAAGLVVALPESVKFLALEPHRQPRLLATLRRLRPDLTIPDTATIAHTPVQEAPGPGLKQIFGGGLVLITPLLWLLFATALMANYFLNSWMPLVFEASGIPPAQAARISTLYHVGGTLGGIVVSLLLDRFGFAAIAVLFALAAPTITAIGFLDDSPSLLAVAVTLAGFFVLGAQFGNNAAAGLLYPTPFRSKGVGWALAIGRFGSIAGPLLGGLLIALKLPLQALFVAPAVPMATGAAAAIVLARLCYTRFRSLQLDDKPAADTPSTPA